MKNKIQIHIRYLYTDFWGEFSFLSDKISMLINKVISTLYMRLLMRLKKISYGKHVQFKGRALFFRHQCSTIEIGDNCTFNSSLLENHRGINHKCIIETGEEGAIIKIGNNCGLSGVSIVCSRCIEIGDNVLIGANAQIGDRDDHKNRFHIEERPVKIGNNVWVGMNSLILKGVTIGEGAIVAANAVVTHDVPSYTIVAGNPAKVVKKIK